MEDERRAFQPEVTGKEHQYLLGLRSWPEAGQRERLCPSPHPPYPPTPNDAPTESERETERLKL